MDKRVCVIENCSKERYNKQNYCVMHYARWKRNGDPNVKYKTTISVCAICGKEFKHPIKYSRSKYCSEDCRNKGELAWREKRQEESVVKKNCLYCGSEFWAVTWPFNNSFCSGVCKGKSNAEDRVSEANCRLCGVVFKTPNRHFNTCPHCARENMLKKVKRRNKKIRYLRRGAEGPYHNESEWNKLVNYYNGMCAYCGDRAAEHKDHIIPISRGGKDSIGNILPACRDCNLSKGNKYLFEWKHAKAVKDNGKREKADPKPVEAN